MTAEAGARDVLLAYQPVGPSVARLIALARQYPATRFSVIADDEGAVRAIGAAAAADGREVPVLLDLDVGMHRTGSCPGSRRPRPLSCDRRNQGRRAGRAPRIRWPRARP
jgi:D-serine deaminase-like pyridoxal phosphate-dependent protein